MTRCLTEQVRCRKCKAVWWGTWERNNDNRCCPFCEARQVESVKAKVKRHDDDQPEA